MKYMKKYNRLHNTMAIANFFLLTFDTCHSILLHQYETAFAFGLALMWCAIAYWWVESARDSIDRAMEGWGEAVDLLEKIRDIAESSHDK